MNLAVLLTTRRAFALCSAAPLISCQVSCNFVCGPAVLFFQYSYNKSNASLFLFDFSFNCLQVHFRVLSIPFSQYTHRNPASVCVPARRPGALIASRATDCRSTPRPARVWPRDATASSCVWAKRSSPVGKCKSPVNPTRKKKQKKKKRKMEVATVHS